MAGHSKWANIRHRKSAQDSKRGKLFTRLIRELTVAARLGAQPEDNPHLRQALERALAANMPRDTINRAISRGDKDGGARKDVQEVNYEGYGPCGVAVFVETITDNKNRTVAEVRNTFGKHGGKLGTDGSVAYLFKRMGEIGFDATANIDDVIEIAASLHADDVLEHEDGVQVLTTAADFDIVCGGFIAKQLTPIYSRINMRASTTIDVIDPQHMEQLESLLEALEALDDVYAVHHNAGILADTTDSAEC